METEKHMKAIPGNVTFQYGQCYYKANKPKINYRQENWCPVHSLICPMNRGLMHLQLTLLQISFSTELTGATCSNKIKQSFRLITCNMF